MATNAIDRELASRLMKKAGLNVLVVTEPEAFKYVTGASSGVAALFRRAGAGFAAIPADPSKPIVAIVPDHAEAEFRRMSHVADILIHPIWIETIDVVDSLECTQSTDRIASILSEKWKQQRPAGAFRRPATFDLSGATTLLRRILESNALLSPSARIGMDLDFISHNALTTIRQILVGNEIVDGSDVLRRLMAIKSPGEIAVLGVCSQLAEAGLRHAFETIQPGQTASDLRSAFRRGVSQYAELQQISASIGSWEYIAIGPNPKDAESRVTDGFSIKADVGCVIDGYSSDCSRNFIFGAPSLHHQELHAALEGAFQAGLQFLRPGFKLGEVHRAAEEEMVRRGFVGYSRGHFGHGLGASVFSEQWPFICADGDVEIEPNMVLAFEIPIEVIGLGSFNLEDQFLITPEGPQSMNRLPRTLIRVGQGRSLDPAPLISSVQSQDQEFGA